MILLLLSCNITKRTNYNNRSLFLKSLKIKKGTRELTNHLNEVRDSLILAVNDTIDLDTVLIIHYYCPWWHGFHCEYLIISELVTDNFAVTIGSNAKKKQIEFLKKRDLTVLGQEKIVLDYLKTNNLDKFYTDKRNQRWLSHGGSLDILIIDFKTKTVIAYYDHLHEFY